MERRPSDSRCALSPPRLRPEGQRSPLRRNTLTFLRSRATFHRNRRSNGSDPATAAEKCGPPLHLQRYPTASCTTRTQSHKRRTRTASGRPRSAEECNAEKCSTMTRSPMPSAGTTRSSGRSGRPFRDLSEDPRRRSRSRG
jgi:hypothetical protein